MSAPALPDTFGNYALGNFVEAVSPQAINWLPQTTGWWWLGAALLTMLLRYGWRRLRHWYRNRYRREATVRLQQLGSAADQGRLIEELNRLMKLTALAAFSREQVASLSGEDWVDFLNSRCNRPPFSSEQSKLLAVSAYRSEVLEADTRQQLLAACLTWVCDHENIPHV